MMETTAMETETRGALVQVARDWGLKMAGIYRDEFGALPADEPELVGDWDSSAWELTWQGLARNGATADDYEACLAAFRDGLGV
jgi:hypothetical protein